MARSSERVTAIGSYELWFVSQLTMAVVFIGGATFLLPQFVLSLPGSNPGDVGIIMAMLPLIAMGAPLVGSLLDRFGAFRAFHYLGLGLFVAGFLVLGIADELIGAATGSLILGIGAAFVVTTNLAMLAGSGLPGDEMSSRMTMLQMSTPMGQFLGLVVVAALLFVGVSFSGVFFAMAAVSVLGLVVTAATNGSAVQRVLRHAERLEADELDPDAADASPETLGSVLWSSFGLVLLVVFLSMVAHGALESQYPNLMQNVFSIDGELAAVAGAVAVALSLPFYPVVGRWIQRAPYKHLLLTAIAGRAAAGLGLWFVAGIVGLPVWIPLAIYGVVMLMVPFGDVSQALLAASSSPIGPASGQGALGFALAAAGVVGAGVTGWAADSFGYVSLGVVAAVVAGAAIVLGVFIPAYRTGSE